MIHLKHLDVGYKLCESENVIKAVSPRAKNRDTTLFDRIQVFCFLASWSNIITLEFDVYPHRDELYWKMLTKRKRIMGVIPGMR